MKILFRFLMALVAVGSFVGCTTVVKETPTTTTTTTETSTMRHPVGVSATETQTTRTY